MTTVRVVTEGRLDFAVAARLVNDLGVEAIPTGPRSGRPALLARLNDYNIAAQYEPWFVLLDLDTEDCAPSLIAASLPNPASGMFLRVAVREIESWLLADSGLARYIRIPARRIPAEVEKVVSPKRRLVELVRTHCRTKVVRTSIVPRTRDATVSDLYNDFMIEFVRQHWDPVRASERSDSLRRCLAALERLTA